MGAYPNYGPGIFAECITLICLSTVFVAARFYVRHFMLKTLGPDDWAALMALMLAIAESTVDANLTKYGSGRHLENVSPAELAKFHALFPTAELLLFLSSGMARMSILLFLKRLLNTYKPLWPGIVLLTVYTLGFFFAFIFQCRPVKALWNRKIAERCLKSQDEAMMMYIHGGIGVLMDFALLIAPMIILWKRLILRKMRFRMLAVFSVGMFACVAAITRLAIITTVDVAKDMTWNVGRTTLWTDLEVHTGIIVGCCPAIQPIFRWVRKKLTGQSTTNGSKYPENRPNTLGVHSTIYRRGLGSSDLRSGRGDLELYSMHTKVELRETGNDSQEAIVQEGGIYKHIDVEVRVEDRMSEIGEEGASVKSEDGRRLQ